MTYTNVHIVKQISLLINHMVPQHQKIKPSEDFVIIGVLNEEER